MKILFNDILQKTNCPRQLKSPALADVYAFEEGELFINFGRAAEIDCIGIGNCSAGEITVTFPGRIAVDGGKARGGGDTVIDGGGGEYAVDGSPGDSPDISFAIKCKENGLYLLGKAYTVMCAVITAPEETTVGRIGMGKAVRIPTSVAKEPGFFSTAEPRRTLSGQIVPGAGGYNYRVLSLDSRYKTGPEAVNEIIAGSASIGAGCPFFIDLSEESYKLPFGKFYGAEKNQLSMSFEGGIRRYLYSRRWVFEEAF